MRKKRLAGRLSASLLIVVLAAAAAWAGEYEALLDKGLRSNEPYSYALLLKDGGRQALNEAIIVSPDSPDLYMRAALRSVPNLFASVQFIAEGLKAYTRNFWWSASLYALVLSSVLLALFWSLAVVVLVRAAVGLKLLAHDINESKRKFLLPLMLLPIALVGPAAFVAGTLVVLGLHLRKIDKTVVFIGLTGLLLSTFAVDHLNVHMGVAAAPEMRAIVEVNEGRGNSYALGALGQSTSEAGRFSYALALKRTGRHSEAVSLYNELAAKSQDWKVHNNLGNTYAAMDLPDKAKDAYSRADELQSNAVTLYNLSQVYRGTLDYTTGDRYYNDAALMNQRLVSGFTAISSENPNRFVVDVTLGMGELWDLASGYRLDIIKPFPLGGGSARAVSLVMLAVFGALTAMVKSNAFKCDRCGVVSCPVCGKASASSHLCSKCHKAFVEMEGLDRQKRVNSLLQSQYRKETASKITKVLSLLPPGIAHIYAGKVLKGMLLLWAFLFCLFALVMNPFIGTGMGGLSHGWLSPILAVVLLTLYVVATITVNRGVDRGWL